MKKYLVLYAVAVTALFAFSYRRYHAESRRLIQNQTALAADVVHYRTRAGQEAASAQVLRLRCGEFEALRAADAEEIRRLGLRNPPAGSRRKDRDGHRSRDPGTAARHRRHPGTRLGAGA